MTKVDNVEIIVQVLFKVYNGTEKTSRIWEIAKALAEVGLIRGEVDESKYLEAIKWIENSDHQNGCSWSIKLPQDSISRIDYFQSKIDRIIEKMESPVFIKD